MAREMTDDTKQRAGWTTNKPTAEGWYWWQRSLNDEPRVVHITDFYQDKMLRVEFTSGDYGRVSNCSGEWRGPITPDDGDREYRRGLEEAAKVVDAKRDELLAAWENDEDVPKGEHDEADCQSACDLYCVQVNTLAIVASTLNRLAQEARR